MRKRFEVQLELGAVPIEEIEILRSRDALPAVLAGLQWLFAHQQASEEVFEILESKLTLKQKRLGRKGLDLWTILVLGVVRLTLNMSYDRLHYNANHDSLMRQFLGEKAFDTTRKFSLTTIKENVHIIDEETLLKINAIIARHGQQLLQNKNSKTHLKTDSYVLETNVHFPTDLNLAWDSARKCIQLSQKLSKSLGVTGWRKHKDWEKRIKSQQLKTAKACRSGGKNKEERVASAALEYLDSLTELHSKVSLTIKALRATNHTKLEAILIGEIVDYHQLLDKFIDQIKRRLIENETIPQKEKLYSIFERHTEWIAKGKSRPNVELGHRLLITTDQHGLIHDYKIMDRSVDVEEVNSLTERLLNTFGEGNIASISFDKGFSSKENREHLEKHIDTVIMPKKGKLSQADKERQSSKQWKKLRNAHSAIESDINCLEHHGLDRCPDRGYKNYKRYTGLGVLAYNLHKIGNKLLGIKRGKKKAA